MNLIKKYKLISTTLVLSILLLLLYNYVPKILFQVGITNFNQKNFEKSSYYFSKALLLEPDNIDFRYYYVSAISELKPSYSIQKAIYAYASDENKSDGAKVLAQNKLAEWQKIIKSNSGNNYIEQAPADSKIIRWNKESFPLNVYIDTTTTLPDYYISSVRQALNQWQSAIDFISFKTTDKRNDAQIVISFKNLPDNVCDDNVCKYVAGYTNPKIISGKLTTMEITIYDKDPKGEYFTTKEIYNTILHELGHSLGIMGHSYSTSDLMYQQNQEQTSIFAKHRSEFQYLTQSDINTVKLLYMLEPNITDKTIKSTNGLIYTPVLLGSPKEMAGRKVKEALQYIKQSPELSTGYINLAGAYTELGEYRKAIDALDNALDLANDNNEKYIIFYNYAYTYGLINEYKTALQYAQMAKNIQPTQEIIELIGILENNKAIN